MWSLLRKKLTVCGAFRDTLEAAPDRSALPAAFEQHLATCVKCRVVAEEFFASRHLLEALRPSRFEPSPWFAGLVMSAIAARETELKRSLETWTVVPKLAARLTWVSAVALLLVGTWLYERPKSAPLRQGDTANEPLFDSAPSSPAQDDLLAGIVETN